MASVIIGDSEIDYSLVDGRVRSFTLNGRVLYDESGINEPDWRESLYTFVRQHGLDEDDGHGVRAFVPLLEAS